MGRSSPGARTPHSPFYGLSRGHLEAVGTFHESLTDAAARASRASAGLDPTACFSSLICCEHFVGTSSSFCPITRLEEANLVGAVHEMHWDAERQGVVVRVPQQDGDDLHTRRSGLPLPVGERPLHGPLAVHGILPHLAPGRTEVEREWVWYLGNEIFGGSPWVCVALQVLFQVPQEMLLGKEESDAQGQQLPALREIKDNPF